MKFAVLALALLLGAVVWAQESSSSSSSSSSSVPQQALQAPADARFLAVASASPDGRAIVTFTNKSSMTIAAFALDITPDTSTSSSEQAANAHVFFDAAYNYRMDIPILRDRSVVRPVPATAGNKADSMHVAVKAVVYIDGTTAGDPDWINKVMARRRRALVSINQAYSIMDKGISRGDFGPDKIVADLVNQRNTDAKEIDDPDVSAAVNRVFSSAISTLRAGGQRQFAAAINTLRDLFDPWRNALENALPPQS